MSLFDNCIIQAPDGTPLSRCGMKKVRWYLKKDLATVVSEDPVTIRLRFEPEGRRNIEDSMMSDSKQNICIVCGSTENLTRHHIIPYSFIRHMDIMYKVDIIRDIMAVCRDCHNVYEQKSKELREHIAERLGICVVPSNVGYLHKVIGSAMALVKSKDQIPLDRQIYLKSVIKEFLNKPEITEQDILDVANYKKENSDKYAPFSKKVADSIEDYNEFAKEWRTHFVETMNPQFLPQSWQVDRETKNVWIPRRMREQAFNKRCDQ